MPITNLDSWKLELAKSEEEIGGIERLKALRQAFVFLTLGAAVEIPGGGFQRLSGVILLTPVDTGRARGSWDVYVSSDVKDVTGAGGQTQALTVAEAALANASFDQDVWISSNLPYIEVLEYGSYPDPVLLGTYTKGKGFVVKSSGGYSKQAPQGMVRITLQQIKEIFESMGMGAEEKGSEDVSG